MRGRFTRENPQKSQFQISSHSKKTRYDGSVVLAETIMEKTREV